MKTTNGRKKETAGICGSCGGPMVSKDIQHNLYNDDYNNFLIVKKYVCTWCGREETTDMKWV